MHVRKNLTGHVHASGHWTPMELENQTNLLSFLGCSLEDRLQYDKTRGGKLTKRYPGSEVTQDLLTSVCRAAI